MFQACRFSLDRLVLGTRGNHFALARFSRHRTMEAVMGFGRGALLWLLGIPLPIILILALFMNR